MKLMQSSQLVKLDQTHLELKPNLPYEEWSGLFNQLRFMEGALAWWIGDALNYGEATYGEIYSQAADETGYSANTLANMKYVASNVSPSLRREKVAWSKHMEVASLEPPEQKRILAEAEKKRLTVNGVRALVQKTKGFSPKPQPAKYCPECGATLP